MKHSSPWTFKKNLENNFFGCQSLGAQTGISGSQMAWIRHFIRHKIKGIQSKTQKLGTYEIDKISLSCFDNKRYVNSYVGSFS